MIEEIRRWAEKTVLDSVSQRRVVFLSGARQTGKTTLANTLPLENAVHVSMDDAASLASAGAEPDLFVNQNHGGTLVLDEVQKAPELLLSIKKTVDKNRAPGQFLLAGSANLRFAAAIRDSLAGRMRTIRLRTLSLAERLGKEDTFLERAFQGRFSRPVDCMDRKDVFRVAFEGGYPESLGFSSGERRTWFHGYVDDLLLKDVRDVAEIRKLDVLRSCLEFLAARSSKFFSMEELGAQSGITKPTAENYLQVLEALFLFEKVPAWTKTDYAKAGKRAKWFASDSGLVANVLSWNEAEAVQDPDRVGKLLETWVHHELAVRVDLHGGCTLSHYRDSEKREIDFLVEDGENRMLGIEVKAGAVVRPDDFRHLRWFGEHLAPGPFTGIVLHTGDSVLPFGERLFAVPLAAFGE